MDQPNAITLPADGAPASFAEGTIYFIGTATVLIRWGGFTVLTDPNFLHRGERVHLGYGLHSTRRTEPAMQLSELPKIDVVLLSHLHEDHFDKKVERELDRAMPIVTTRHAAVALQRKGFTSTHALATWQPMIVTKGDATLRVTSMPGIHAPGILQAVLPPVMGSMLDFSTNEGRRFRLYISGDTLVHRALHEIPLRFPDIDLALLHLGGTRVVGLMVTMDGEQGVKAMRIVQPRLAIPIHYDDYTVFKDPLDNFKREVERSGLGGRVHYLDRGDTYRFAVPDWPSTSAPVRSSRPSIDRPSHAR
jgi:L-ascorbate metabolism protein UlaG (beta-lactamase superfamily)